MTRTVLLALTVITLQATVIGAQRQAGAPRQVGAEAFLRAFREGKADQYKGFTVSGEARLAGAITTTDRSGKAEALLLLVGALSATNEVSPVATRRQLLEADVALKPLLMFELSGAGLQAKQDEGGMLASYRFSGRYDGGSREQGRAAVPVGEKPDVFRIPLLVAGTAQ